MNPLPREQQHETDRELITRAAGGDQAAFRSLMETHHRYAFALAMGLLQNEDDAGDVVQDSFIRVWNNLDRYRPDVRFTTWLYKIVVNLCYDRMKMEKRRSGMLESLAAFFGTGRGDDGGDPHRELERSELRERIMAAAGTLPPMERLIFHLRDVQDLSIVEAAEVAGISVGAVKTNLCYARKRIRTILTGRKDVI